MKPIMALEFVSGVAPEMSWFHGLPAGKGRNPFRLPSSPTAKPLQPVVPPETALIVAVADFEASATLVAETV
jgi:hypothetical protein